MENIGYLGLFFLGLSLGIVWAELKHKPKKFKCKACGKVCKSRSGLGSHMRIHNKIDY